MTAHELEFLFTIINVACIGAWLGSFITYVWSVEEENPYVMLSYWLIGIILVYPILWIVLLWSFMALLELYSILKIGKTK